MKLQTFYQLRDEYDKAINDTNEESDDETIDYQAIDDEIFLEQMNEETDTNDDDLELEITDDEFQKLLASL